MNLLWDNEDLYFTILPGDGIRFKMPSKTEWFSDCNFSSMFIVEKIIKYSDFNGTKSLGTERYAKKNRDFWVVVFEDTGNYPLDLCVSVKFLK